jgi:hypothetical protein
MFTIASGVVTTPCADVAMTPVDVTIIELYTLNAVAKNAPIPNKIIPLILFFIILKLYSRCRFNQGLT